MDTLTILIYAVVIFTLMFVIYCMNTVRSENKQKVKGEEVPSLEVSKEEYYKVLNFMLMYGVIEFEEYNKIQTKGLPYVRQSFLLVCFTSKYVPIVY